MHRVLSGVLHQSLSPVVLVHYRYSDSQYHHPFDAAVDCLGSSAAIDCRNRHHCFPTTSRTYNRQWSGKDQYGMGWDMFSVRSDTSIRCGFI